MVCLQVLIKRLNLLFLFLLIFTMWISCGYPAYGDTHHDFTDRESIQIQGISPIAKVKEPFNSEKLPTATQLMDLSIRLRDIARFLGSNWRIIVPISDSTVAVSQTDADKQSRFQITDFRKPDGQWTSITAGHALNLVTQELEILNTSREQPLINFRVEDKTSGDYLPLLNVPLSYYCYKLLEIFES